MKKIIENRFIYQAIITIISLYVLVAFVKLSNINGYERAMFSDMVYGTAWKPFVYRTLLPTTVRLISEVIPEDIHNSLSEKTESSKSIILVLEKFK